MGMGMGMGIGVGCGCGRVDALNSQLSTLIDLICSGLVWSGFFDPEAVPHSHPTYVECSPWLGSEAWASETLETTQDNVTL